MWDTKFRPHRFSDVIGQQGIVEVLKARLRKGQALESSYIFAGGHGQGKTTLARILARAALCQNLQEGQEPCNECDNCTAILTESSVAFQELDAASKGTIDNVRSIVDDLGFMVPGAKKRIILFDEMHRMSKDSQDVLLKPIEDKKMVGIFCTTEKNKIRPTITSRCEVHDVRKVTRDDIFGRMKYILTSEGVEFEEDAIWVVIDYSGGHVRDVIRRMEMVAQLGAVSVESVRSYLNLAVVSTYYEILLSLGDVGKALALVDDACDRVGPDEVMSGLAEAAMNSYRLVHGMTAEFVYVDRGLAKQVHERYGDAVVDLARFFVSSRTTGKVGVLSEVMSLIGSGGKVPTRAVAQPSIVIAAQVPALAPAPTPAPETPKAPEVPKEAPKAAVPAASKEATVEPPKVEPPLLTLVSKNGLRADGKGNLGSSDPEAQTDVDTYGIRQTLPRGATSRRTDTGPKAVKAKVRELELLQPEEWQREFERTWRGRTCHEQ